MDSSFLEIIEAKGMEEQCRCEMISAAGCWVSTSSKHGRHAMEEGIDWSR